MTEVKKIPIIEYVKTVVPKYELVEEEIKIPKLIEVPVEGISKKDLDSLKEYGAILDSIFKKLEKIKSYKISEEIIRVKVPEFEKKKIIEPEFIKKQIIEKEYRPVIEEIKVPKFKEIQVEGISTSDIAMIKEVVLNIKELKRELEGIRKYKIQEETFVVDKPIFKPKTIEIEKEKINWVVKDEVITDLEGLIKVFKKNKEQK